VGSVKVVEVQEGPEPALPFFRAVVSEAVSPFAQQSLNDALTLPLVRGVYGRMRMCRTLRALQIDANSCETNADPLSVITRSRFVKRDRIKDAFASGKKMRASEGKAP
jgi:hypothetical protein